jgi:hypothetical protein
VLAAVQVEEDHPNRMVVKGILVQLDKPSTKPPGGARGHRIEISTAVAEKCLDTLKGMGVNYHPKLEEHNITHKVGVVDKAWIDGQDLWVECTIWKRDFPDAEEDLGKPNLGMSMELSNVQVEDVDADVWQLLGFYFTGLTILKKSSAAYSDTLAQIAASVATEVDIEIKALEEEMAEKVTKDAVTPTPKVFSVTEEQLATVAASAAKQAVQKIVPIIKKQNDVISEMQSSLDALLDDETTVTVTAGEATDEEVDAASKKKAADKNDDASGDNEDDEADDDDMYSETTDGGIDKGNLDDTGPGVGSGQGSPGHMADDSTNHGSDTTSNTKVGPTVTSSAHQKYLAARKQLKIVTAANAALEARIAKLERVSASTSATVRAAADRAVRKSLTPELSTLLSKNSIDPVAIQAGGKKLTSTEVDAMIKNIGGLDPERSIAWKQELQRGGYMD